MLIGLLSLILHRARGEALGSGLPGQAPGCSCNAARPKGRPEGLQQDGPLTGEGTEGLRRAGWEKSRASSARGRGEIFVTIAGFPPRGERPRLPQRRAPAAPSLLRGGAGGSRAAPAHGFLAGRSTGLRTPRPPRPSPVYSGPSARDAARGTALELGPGPGPLLLRGESGRRWPPLVRRDAGRGRDSLTRRRGQAASAAAIFGPVRRQRRRLLW